MSRLRTGYCLRLRQVLGAMLLTLPWVVVGNLSARTLEVAEPHDAARIVTPPLSSFSPENGVIWRINIDEDQATFIGAGAGNLPGVGQEVDGAMIDPLELPDVATQSRTSKNSYVDIPELMGDGVEVSDDFHKVYQASGLPEGFEPLIPDSFATDEVDFEALVEAVDTAAANFSLSAAPGRSKAGGGAVSHAAAPFVADAEAFAYEVNLLSGLTLSPLESHAATVPYAERVGSIRPGESVYVNYPTGEVVQRTLRQAVQGDVGISSREGLNQSGRLYALPSQVSQFSLLEVVSQTGDSGQNVSVSGSGTGSGTGTAVDETRNVRDLRNVPVSVGNPSSASLFSGLEQQAAGATPLRSTRTTRTIVVDSSQGWSARTINSSAFTETWSNTGNAEGWVSRDGEMTVGQLEPGGNPGGYLNGTFAAGVFFPQTDSFTIDSVNSAGTNGEDLLGDYGAIDYWNGWTFDFYAEDVLPSDLIFRFSDGTRTFLYDFGNQVTTVGAWQQIRIYPFPEKFVGGSAFEFYETIDDITQIDIQITRNGFGEQDFRIDNFGYLGHNIPEPSTLGFFVVGNMLFIMRMQLLRRRKKQAAVPLSSEE